MSYSRLAGWALLLASALALMISLLPLLPGLSNPDSWPVWLTGVNGLSYALMGVGLPALYTSQKQAGLFGITGLLLLIPFVLAGLLINILGVILPREAPQPGPPPDPLIGAIITGVVLASALGWCLIAAGILRAQVFPRWTAWALIASSVVLIISTFVPGAPAGLLYTLVTFGSGLLAAAGTGWIGLQLAGFFKGFALPAREREAVREG